MRTDELQDLLDRESIAIEIKAIFYKKKQQIHGRPYRPHARFNSFKFWLNAADKCVELEANPEEYVDAVFSYCPDVKMLLPHMIYGAGMNKWWKAYTGNNKSLKIKIFQTIGNEVTRLKNITNSWKKEDYYEYVVDDTYFLYSHYRVFFFPGDEEIVKKFGVEAYTFLTTKPAYLKALCELGFELEKFLTLYKGIHAE